MKWAQLSNQEKRDRGIVSKAGVSIVRAHREVDYGWFFLGNKRKENYDEWWRCEVHFDPILDEAFGLNHTKQQIRPQQYILEALSPDIEATARTLNARARTAHAQLKRSRSAKRSESITSDRSDFLEPVQGVRATRLMTPYRICVAPLEDGCFLCVSISARPVPFNSRSGPRLLQRVVCAVKQASFDPRSPNTD